MITITITTIIMIVMHVRLPFIILVMIDDNARSVRLLAMMIFTHATPKGFEPLRAEPNALLAHHRNHSVTMSCKIHDLLAMSPTVITTIIMIITRDAGAEEPRRGRPVQGRPRRVPGVGEVRALVAKAACERDAR